MSIMKRQIRFLLSLAVALAFLLVTGMQSALAQDSKGDTGGEGTNKMSKQEIQAKNKQQILDIIKNKDFVLESNFIQNKYGYRLFINPLFNFIMVNGDTATIQLTFDHFPGWNGVGGITWKGIIDQYKLKPGGAHSAIYLQMHVQGAGIASYQFLTVDANGNADLHINGDYGGQVTFSGNLMPIDKSGVIEGHATNN
jgi:hypothetical protein